MCHFVTELDFLEITKYKNRSCQHKNIHFTFINISSDYSCSKMRRKKMPKLMCLFRKLLLHLLRRVYVIHGGADTYMDYRIYFSVILCSKIHFFFQIYSKVIFLSFRQVLLKVRNYYFYRSFSRTPEQFVILFLFLSILPMTADGSTSLHIRDCKTSTTLTSNAPSCVYSAGFTLSLV